MTLPFPLTYALRVCAGVESLAFTYISLECDITLLRQEHRTLIVQSNDHPASLLGLRQVDDVFLLIGEFSDLDHTRESLKKLSAQFLQFDIQEALSTLEDVRPLNLTSGHSITASFLGKRNYNRWELEASVQETLSQTLKGPYLSAKDRSLPEHDLHIRIHLEGNKGWCGLRLSKAPLFKRDYKALHQQASLTPPLAYLMAQMAEISAHQRILDPFCGAGTIPIEAQSLCKNLAACGSDLSADSLAISQVNASVARSTPYLIQADAFALPFDSLSIQAIVSDLPWDFQSELKTSQKSDLSSLYNSLLKEWDRILSSSAPLILMAHENQMLKECAHTQGYALEQETPISLYGKHPSILKLRKSS